MSLAIKVVKKDDGDYELALTVDKKFEQEMIRNDIYCPKQDGTPVPAVRVETRWDLDRAQHILDKLYDAVRALREWREYGEEPT